MKRYKLCINMIILLFSFSCKNEQKVDARLVYIKKDSCYYFCNQLKISFKNNSAEKIYIPKVIIANDLHIFDDGKDISEKFFLEESMYYSSFIKPEIKDGKLLVFDSIFKLNGDTMQLSYQRRTNKYAKFISSAIKSELNCYYSSISDTLDYGLVKSILELKYKSIILLEPYGCAYEIININTLIQDKKRYSLTFNDMRDYSDGSIIGNSGNIIKIEGKPLNEINNYDLYEGAYNLDTLIIY